MSESIVIVSIARTPQGNLLGVLKDVPAPNLGGVAIKAALERANLVPTDISEVIFGCVLPAGQGQAPARQAAFQGGLSASTPCTTVNKMCGSGMKAVMIAYDELRSNNGNQVIVAGGMESMTNAPYLIPKARQGYRLGKAEILDHMTWDGLEDAYDKGRPMGYFAEMCVEKFGFTRQEQDEYAKTSLTRAQHAIENHLFDFEIAPVTVKTRQGEVVISVDEHPSSVKIEKIPELAPVFKKDGTVTAANSSSIADGAAALILMTESEAKRRNIKPLAKIVNHTSHAQKPEEFTTAPIAAIQKLLKKNSWTIDDVDLFEVNEAFAVVAMAAQKELNIPHAKLNVRGSGVALGHPIGATGARIIVTLIAALKHENLKRGIAALCIGGGEATAIGIELV